MKPRYWDQVIARYISSGLKQEEFCILESIPFNKFKYHWKQHRAEQTTNKLSKAISTSFEAIKIQDKEVISKLAPQSKAHSLSLKFSNDITCILDFEGNSIELAMFLKEISKL